MAFSQLLHSGMALFFALICIPPRNDKITEAYRNSNLCTRLPASPRPRPRPRSPPKSLARGSPPPSTVRPSEITHGERTLAASSYVGKLDRFGATGGQFLLDEFVVDAVTACIDLVHGS